MLYPERQTQIADIFRKEENIPPEEGMASNNSENARTMDRWTWRNVNSPLRFGGS